MTMSLQLETWGVHGFRSCIGKLIRESKYAVEEDAGFDLM